MPENVRPKVELRPVQKEDLPALFEHQRDPVAVQMVLFKSRNWEEFQAHWEKILRDPSCLARAITVDGVIAGQCGSFERGGVRELGYWLGREFWGRGVGSEAVRQFLLVDGSRPLHAVIAEHNKGSQRVAEKNGFRFVKVEKEDDAVLWLYVLE